MTEARSYSDIRQVKQILDRLLNELRTILRERLVGVYLYGSLITGDFDISISDIDLVVVLTAELDAPRFAALQRMHKAVVQDYPQWHDRLELAYISARGLAAFQTRSSVIGIISPGEPFHLVQAGEDWLISWYALREKGIALLGPPIKSLIDPLPLEAWLKAVREHICAYRESVKTAPDKSFLAYIVLTVARGLYTLAHQRDASKVRAAKWLASAYPRWANLVERALIYRHSPAADALETERMRAQVEAYLTALLSEAACGDAGQTA